CLILFVWFFISVYFGGILTVLNEPITALMRSLRLPEVENIAIVITFMGDKKILLPVTLLFGLWLLWRRCFQLAFIWFFVILGGTATGYFFKHIYFSPRPEGLLNGPDSSSFPSGHTTIAMLVYGLMAFLIASSVNKSKCALIYGIS